MVNARTVSAFHIPTKEDILELFKDEPEHAAEALLALVLTSRLTAMKLEINPSASIDDKGILASKSVDTLSAAFGFAEYLGLENQLKSHMATAIAIMELCQEELPFEHPLFPETLHP